MTPQTCSEVVCGAPITSVDQEVFNLSHLKSILAALVAEGATDLQIISGHPVRALFRAHVFHSRREVTGRVLTAEEVLTIADEMSPGAAAGMQNHQPANFCWGFESPEHGLCNFRVLARMEIFPAYRAHLARPTPYIMMRALRRSGDIQ